MIASRKWILFLTGWLLLVLSLPASEPAAAPEDVKALDLDQIKKLIQAGDWKAAYQAAQRLTGADQSGKGGRRTPRLDAFEWTYFESYLQTAANYPDNHSSQKKARAKAAQMLRLHDLALEQYVAQIKLADSDTERDSARSDLALCAYQAAGAANYDRAGKMFDLMRDNGTSWVKEAGQKKGEMVRQLAQSSKDVAFRIEFAQTFWVDNVPALGSDYQQASKLLIETLKLDPTLAQRQQIFSRLLSYAQKLEDAAGAEQYAVRIAKEFAGQDVVDEAFFSIAHFYFQKQRFAQSRDWLLKIVESGRTNQWVPLAQLGLSETYANLKDEPAMLRWLEKAAEAEPIPTNRGIMDTSDTKQVAIQRLGLHYQAKGDYQKALAYFTRWQPRSWCGTCRMQMQESRLRSMTTCLMHLNDPATAIKHCLNHPATFNEYPSHGSLFLFQLYRDAGQLDDLLRLVDGKPGTFAELVRIHRLSVKQNVAALVAICQSCEPGWHDTQSDHVKDWRCKAAAEALAGCAGKEIAAISQALPEQGKSRSWLIYALGKSPSPEALKVLARLAQEDAIWENSDANNLGFALSLKGETGKQLLREIADGSKRRRGWAETWLQKGDEPASTLAAWPRPRPGSLPKSIKE